MSSLPIQRNSVSYLLKQALEQLGAFDSPRLEAEILLAYVLGCSRTYLRTWPIKTVSKEKQNLFKVLLNRRLKQEPLAYIIQKQAFWTLDLFVNDSVLIPRQDTEILVEKALEILPSDFSEKILELGTGSGAIAMSLAKERPMSQILATDCCEKALSVAHINSDVYKLSNLTLIQSDWFQKIPSQHFDMIVSNPPYLAQGDEHLQKDGLQFEPEGALVSGKDGLNALRKIISSASEYLKRKGWLLVEHGYSQRKSVHQLFEQAGFSLIQTQKDHNACDRITFGQKY